MLKKRSPDGETGQPMIYQFRIKGHLGRHWADRFEELNIRKIHRRLLVVLIVSVVSINFLLI